MTRAEKEKRKPRDEPPTTLASSLDRRPTHGRSSARHRATGRRPPKLERAQRHKQSTQVRGEVGAPEDGRTRLVPSPALASGHRSAAPPPRIALLFIPTETAPFPQKLIRQVNILEPVSSCSDRWAGASEPRKRWPRRMTPTKPTQEKDERESRPRTHRTTDQQQDAQTLLSMQSMKLSRRVKCRTALVQLDH